MEYKALLGVVQQKAQGHRPLTITFDAAEESSALAQPVQPVYGVQGAAQSPTRNSRQPPSSSISISSSIADALQTMDDDLKNLHALTGASDTPSYPSSVHMVRQRTMFLNNSFVVPEVLF